MKRCSVVLLAFLLVFSAFFTLRASAESSATKTELYCTVNAEGDCLVSMTVNLHLEASDTGLMFPLPYSATNITMNGSSVATTRSGNATLAAVGRVTNGMVGDFPVRFDFSIPKAVHASEDYKSLVLELPMLCGFEYPVENLSFIITLPGNVPGNPVFTSIYQQTGFEANLSLVIHDNMITGTSKNALNDHEAVTMTMTVPQSMFPSVSIYQRTGNPELIPMGIFAGLALLYWILFLRTLPPMRQRASVPPAGVTAGEMNCRVTMSGGDLTMMVLTWAQMGYLLIQPDGSRVLLHKQMSMGNERSLFEVRVFQTLFNNRRVVDCSSPGYANLCRKAAGMIPGEKNMCKPNSGSRKIFRILLCIAQGFCGLCIAMNMTALTALQVLLGIVFSVLSIASAWLIQEYASAMRSRYHFRAWLALGLCVFWVLLGAVAGQPWIPLGAVLVQLMGSYLSAYGGMRTELNRNEASEILGLRRYLRSIPRPEAARLIKNDSEYFFRMAPYAIALGVGKQFADLFGRRKIDQCPFLVTRNSSRRTAQEWMRILTQCTLLMDARWRRTEAEKWMPVRFR